MFKFRKIEIQSNLLNIHQKVFRRKNKACHNKTNQNDNASHQLLHSQIYQILLYSKHVSCIYIAPLFTSPTKEHSKIRSILFMFFPDNHKYLVIFFPPNICALPPLPKLTRSTIVESKPRRRLLQNLLLSCNTRSPEHQNQKEKHRSVSSMSALPIAVVVAVLPHCQLDGQIFQCTEQTSGSCRSNS